MEPPDCCRYFLGHQREQRRARLKFKLSASRIKIGLWRDRRSTHGAPPLQLIATTPRARRRTLPSTAVAAAHGGSLPRLYAGAIPASFVLIHKVRPSGAQYRGAASSRRRAAGWRSGAINAKFPSARMAIRVDSR
jgi:hypothetical protein